MDSSESRGHGGRAGEQAGAGRRSGAAMVAAWLAGELRVVRDGAARSWKVKRRGSSSRIFVADER